MTATAPSLAAEWDYKQNKNTLPTQITFHSNRLVWWRCEKGHTWRASPNHRSSGTGCPYCNSNRLIPEKTSLAVKFPTVAMQWDVEKNAPITAKDVTAFNNEKYWWRCAEGHSWMATVSNRSHGEGCPYCANRKPISGVNTLDVLFPQLAYEWHPSKNNEAKPSDYLSKSNARVWWQCENGHEWQASIYDRVNGRSCPKCNKRRRKSKNLI